MTDEIIKLTPQQEKAIAHGKGHLRIIACAGSGKTEVVSRRIAKLIENGASPKNIVAFTFTEKAAEELKSRIRTILDKTRPDKADFGDMYVGTIHSFCFQMLKELEPKYKNYDVLDAAKRVAYISKKNNFGKRLNLWPLTHYGKSGGKLRPYTVIDRFIKSVDIMLAEDIDPSKLTNERFRIAFQEYCKMLHEDKYLDFSSMIYILVKHLETDRKVLKMLNEKVKHLIVDEYQDVNGIQEKLVEFISIGAESVCVVGDDDQCIFQWRGSHVQNIIDFDKRYSKYHVKDISLETNFRSTHSIIHTAREFIKHNRNRLKIKEMKHNPELKRTYEAGDIIHHHFNNEEEEYRFIADKIGELEGTDFVDKHNKPFSLSYGDFAVLVRTNDDAAKIVNYLDNRGIECIAYSGSTIFERPEVRLAMGCLSHVFNCRPYNYHEETPKIEDLRAQYENVFGKKDFPLADSASFARELESIRMGMGRILAKSPKDYLGDLGLQAVYHRIIASFGAQRFDFGEVYNYNLAVLSAAVSDYEAVWIRLRASEIDGFFEFARAYGENNYVESQYSDATRINAVKILTVHKAKGLEFPVVFVPCIIKKRKPNPQQTFVDDKLYDVERYNGTEEDERRVYYTAFTRSEKYLFLTGSSVRSGVKTPYEPHPFLAELDRKFITGNVKLKRRRSGHPTRLAKEAIYPTSFSELTTYDRCPYDFKLRYIFGYNAGVPAAFGYGTNIHNILNLIHNKYLASGDVPNDREIDGIIDFMFHLRYATKKITENMRRGARKIVKNYVKLQKAEFRKIIETEKRFEFVLDAAIISGQIDLLKKVDEDGNVTEVEIIDFKTENDKKEKAYQLDYEKQLRLYSIACLKSLGLNPKKATVHHLDNTLLGTKSSVDISPQKLEETKESVRSEIGCIMKKKFEAKPSKVCKACDYRYICSKKGYNEP